MDPETLEPLSREDYGMGVVPFHELVKWGHATKLFNFKSEFISPAAVPWAMAAPSMRDMVTAAQAKAALVVTQEPEAAPLVPPEPPAARALTENSSGGVEPAKAGPLPVLTKRTNRQTWLDVSLPYLVETYKAGQYATAKAFYKALESMAGTGDSPFDMGVGPNARSLFVRAIGQPVALKTMENAWAKIRNSP